MSLSWRVTRDRIPRQLCLDELSAHQVRKSHLSCLVTHSIHVDFNRAYLWHLEVFVDISIYEDLRVASSLAEYILSLIPFLTC